MERKCARCGAVLPQEAIFCAECGTPCNAMPPAGGGKKVKWWMIVAPVVGVLVIAAIVVGLMWNTIYLHLNPIGALSKAIVSTAHDLNQRSEGTLGQALSELVNEDGLYTNEIGIDIDYGSYLTADVSLISQSDIRNRQTYMTLDGALDLMGYYQYDLDLALYADGDSLALNWEQLTGSDFYGLNYGSFEDDFLASEGLRDTLTEEDRKEIADYLDLLSQLLNSSDKEEGYELSTEYTGIILDFLKAHKGTVGSKEISLSSGRQTCNTVTITVTNEELYDLFTALLEVAEEDEGLKSMTFADVNISETDTDTLWDTYMEKCQDALEELDNDGASEFSFYLYKNQVVYLDASFQEEDGEMFISLLLGEDPSQDDITFLLTTEGTDADLEMEMTLTTEVEADKVVESIELTLSGSGENVGITLGYDWDKEDEELTLSWKQNVNGSKNTYELALDLCLEDEGYTLKLPELVGLLGKISPELAKQFEGMTCYVTVTSSHGGDVQEPSFINIRDITKDIVDDLEDKIVSAYGF